MYIGATCGSIFRYNRWIMPALVELSLDHMFNNPISHLVHFVYINTLIQIVLIFLRNKPTITATLLSLPW